MKTKNVGLNVVTNQARVHGVAQPQCAVKWDLHINGCAMVAMELLEGGIGMNVL